MKLVGLWNNDKCRCCGKTKADLIHILYYMNLLLLETKYELMTKVHTHLNKVEGDPSILHILYSVIANKSPKKVPLNLHSITSYLL